MDNKNMAFYTMSLCSLFSLKKKKKKNAEGQCHIFSTPYSVACETKCFLGLSHFGGRL